MKKIIIALIIILLSIGNTFASEYKLSTSDKIIVNKLTSKIQKLIDKQTLSFRITLENKINEIQNKYKTNKKLFTIFEEIKKNTHLYNYNSEYNKHYNSYYINFEKLKTTWLSWHNIERNKLGVTLYSYDKRLNNTTYEWSKYQKENKKIMSHKRNDGDSFYDYHKIEKWFTDRGIRCKVKGGATSSESIGKFGYYCSDNDCTAKLIESLKDIFDIYMAEKNLGYPADAHYRGIIHKDLSKIGLGLSIYKTNEKGYYEYYMTTHYCTEFKK